MSLRLGLARMKSLLQHTGAFAWLRSALPLEGLKSRLGKLKLGSSSTFKPCHADDGQRQTPAPILLPATVQLVDQA